MRRVLRLVRRHPAGALGALILLLVALASALGPLLSPYGFDQQDLAARDRGPGWAHPFGTAELGEDVLTRVMEAGRISLLVGLATALVATVVGASLGLLAGWHGGWVDSLLSRLTDMVLIVPGFALLVVLSVAFERVGPAEVILILSLVSWPPLFRLTRASALRTRDLPYVQAARAAGARSGRVVLRHLLPAAIPEIAPFAALATGLAILAESALSFLSLGIDPATDPTWGNLMIGAQDTIEDRPWLTLFPGAAIVLTVAAVSLLGDAIRDALDPAPGRRLRAVRGRPR